MPAADNAKRAFRSARVRLPQPWSLALGVTAYLPAMAVSRTTRQHFREEATISAVTEGHRQLRRAGAGLSERVIEIPWVQKRVPHGAAQVLDTGTAYAPLVHHRLLYRLPAEVVGADLTPFELPGVRSTVADLRELPFEDGSFDATLCVSTLEHIGMDNSVYFDSNGDRVEEDGDVLALRELGRVTRSGAPVLLTVPGGGTHMSFGWHRQYTPATFDLLVERAELETLELDYFAHDGSGWHRVDAEELAERTYAEGAAAAAGLICASLTR
jgi:hypothetical protein